MMRPAFGLLLLLVPLGVAFSADLPPVVREALVLELDGRLGEALDRYRAALSTDPALVRDEAVTRPLTVGVLSKAAHLSIDLGYGEEAWDLGSKLLAAKNQPAAEAGTLVRLRLYRIQERWTEALKAYEDYTRAWPSPPSMPLMAEELRVRTVAKIAGRAIEARVHQAGGPSAWVLNGDWSRLPSPTESLGLSLQETVRLQVGAFKDWGHALTLIDMLREKGWSPLTDIKTLATGEKLHLVYIISRQAESDKARLEAQGLISPP